VKARVNFSQQRVRSVILREFLAFNEEGLHGIHASLLASELDLKAAK